MLPSSSNSALSGLWGLVKVTHSLYASVFSSVNMRDSFSGTSTAPPSFQDLILGVPYSGPLQSDPGPDREHLALGSRHPIFSMKRHRGT